MDIKPLVEKWKDLILKKSVKESRDFYWRELHSHIEKRFVSDVEERLKNKKLPHYDWLILPAGLEDSYYVLLINALKPKKVYFLCTKEFRNEFLEVIVQKTGLKRDSYEVDVVDYTGMDIAEVYEKLKDKIELFKGNVAVDLTRGKRIISAGAAVLASFFNFDLIYVDEEWMDDIKRGIPGTESLVQVKNPFHIFGDLEKSHAIKLFNQYNFALAAEFFKEIRSKVKDPREYEVLSLLSEAYDYWDAFNYPAALVKMQETLKKIEQFSLKNLDKKQIGANIEVLEILSRLKPNDKLESSLNDDILVMHLLADLYSNAFRRKDMNRLEDAVARLYRLLEMISQYRLAKHNITTSGPEYKNLDNLDKGYNEITQKLYGLSRNLPAEIGIKDGHIILFILKDEIWKSKNFEDLKKFLGPIRLRDNSIIAHGIDIIGAKAFRNIDDICKELLFLLCKILKLDWEKLMTSHRFIKL